MKNSIEDIQLLVSQTDDGLNKLQELEQEELRLLKEMQELFKEKGDENFDSMQSSKEI